MNNSTIWWIILVVVVLLGAYFLFVNREPVQTPATETIPTVNTTTPEIPVPASEVTPVPTPESDETPLNSETPATEEGKQITIFFPNGGEKLESGKTYTITWDSNNVKSVIITLLENNSKSYIIEKAVDATLKKFDWKIDSAAEYIGRNNLKIVLYDDAYCSYVGIDTGVECVKDEKSHSDDSDNYFSVIR